MGLLDSLVVFVVSALVGGLGIYVGASIIAESRNYSHAVWTGLIGALVWGIVSFLFGWIPLLGPVLTLLAYLLVIRSRYEVGWVSAGGIALVAWIAASIVLTLLTVVGFVPGNVVGIPFV